jgi:hypothetical protein
MLRDVLDFQQQPVVLPERYLSHRAVEDAVDSARRRPGKFALHDTFAALARAVEQRHSVSAPRVNSVMLRPSAWLGPKPSSVCAAEFR